MAEIWFQCLFSGRELHMVPNQLLPLFVKRAGSQEHLKRGSSEGQCSHRIFNVRIWAHSESHSPDMLSCFRRWSLMTFPLLIPLKRENRLQVVLPGAAARHSTHGRSISAHTTPSLPPTKCFQDIKFHIKFNSFNINLSFLVVSNSHLVQRIRAKEH